MTPQLFVRLTQNKYAAGTFRTVVLPILDQLTGNLPKGLACEEIGFDIILSHAHSGAQLRLRRKGNPRRGARPH